MMRADSLLELSLGKRNLSIKAHNEAEVRLFRQAEARINQKMDYYRKKYHINDESTFYLMICLDFVTDLIQSEIEMNICNNQLVNLASQLEQALALNLHEESLQDIVVDSQE